ncbi:hypothetical protein M885DRAFT_433856 [Pelagophyceae sp. CCMP2097]|nr:hypothetical protein M885DRAFT_433856 [Pelagophyceae sp. CCMP2097]
MQGRLRAYDGDSVTSFAPKGDRLLIFRSDFVVHDVSAAHVDFENPKIKNPKTHRWALTLWLRTSNLEQVSKRDAEIEAFHFYAGAFQRHSAAAEAGDSEALFDLGECHSHGRGADQDFEKAAECFRKAAVQGHAKASYALGCLHESGRGVPRSASAAAGLFRQAAEQDHADAAYKLASAHAAGKGVDIDDDAAFNWYVAAAEMGHARAQYDAAYCLMCGVGANADADAAAHWLALAYRQARH